MADNSWKKYEREVSRFFGYKRALRIASSRILHRKEVIALAIQGKNQYKLKCKKVEFEGKTYKCPVDSALVQCITSGKIQTTKFVDHSQMNVIYLPENWPSTC